VAEIPLWRNDIVHAEKAGPWLDEIAEGIDLTDRRHKDRIRIFEPICTRS
jgi:hypothetical protein